MAGLDSPPPLLRCGRLEHLKQAGQTGADLERVAKLEERLELVRCDLRPGDAVLFHANILHRSRVSVGPLLAKLHRCALFRLRLTSLNSNS